ncbi:MAG: hypothetical protein JJ855_00325 [Rhodospirillales bacterium]|nr:hypothetical protein [Rhodospirillales bacterium]
MEKIPGKDLVKAGLDIMAADGKPLERVPSRGRSMIYAMQDGRTVRIRTSNDHVLMVVADSPDVDAPVNIEGTDMLLVVMPETERTPGRVIAFLVPSARAAEDAREGYRQWLERNPRTKGNNTTRTLWFDSDLSEASHGFMERWAEYRLAAGTEVSPPETSPPPRRATGIPDRNDAGGRLLRDVVEDAKRLIADAAGVAPENVHITISMD